MFVSVDILTKTNFDVNRKIYMRPFSSNRYKIVNFLLVLMATIDKVDYIKLYTRFMNSNIRSHYIIKQKLIGSIALPVEYHLLNEIGNFW